MPASVLHTVGAQEVEAGVIRVSPVGPFSPRSVQGLAGMVGAVALRRAGRVLGLIAGLGCRGLCVQSGAAHTPSPGCLGSS